MADKIFKVRLQLRNDTEANWQAIGNTFIPLAGEACVTNDGENKGRFKIGDGTTTWSNLSYTGGDSELLAKSVMFDSDLVLTYQFGKYTPVNGKVTVPAKNKSLYELLLDAYSEDKNPTVTKPSLSLSSTTAKAYEVGTKVSPTYNSTFNAGSYQYGPATGITVSSYTASNNVTEETISQATGTFAEYQVGDSGTYVITLTANYTEGSIPKTALEAEYPAGKIAAGSLTKNSSAISGYRNSFYGTTTDKSAETTSSVIRGLSGKSNRALANGNSFNITIPVNATRVIFAYPATLRDVTSVKDVNGLNAEIKSAFTKSTVSVEGANGYTAISYKVYTTDYAQPNDKANTYTVTI